MKRLIAGIFILILGYATQGWCIPPVPGGNATTLQGYDVSATAPTDTYVLTWNAATAKWEAAIAPGAGTGAATSLQYVTFGAEASLSAERVLTESTGIDISVLVADQIRLSVNTTEIGTTTWGSGGASYLWTYNVSGTTDPVITVSDGVFNVSAGTIQQAGTAVQLQGADILAAVGNNAFLISSDVDTSDTLVLRAYDVGSGYDDMITLTASSAPTIAIAADGAITISSAVTTTVESVTFTDGAISTATTLALSHTAPTITLSDSDDAAGTGNILFASANTRDIVGTLQADIDGTATTFISLDGANEEVLFGKKIDITSLGIENVGNIADDAAFSIISSGGAVTVESVVVTGGALTGVTSSDGLSIGDGGATNYMAVSDTGAVTFAGSATFSAAGATSSIPMVVGATTASGVTTAGQMYFESDTEILTIGDGATSITLDMTPNVIYTFPGVTSTLAVVDAPVFTTSIEAPFIILGSAATAADAGAIRLPNNTILGWEIAATGVDATLGVNASDDMVAALVAATDNFHITTGNLKVGAGSETTALDGADAYITGFLEVDGLIYAGTSTTVLTDAAGKILSAALNTVAITQGGTGQVAAATTSGIVYGVSATALGMTAAGAEGKILRAGASPFTPAWSDFTMPLTVTTGTVFGANATNIFSAVSSTAAGPKVLTNASGTITWEDAAAPGAHAIVGASHTLAAATAGTLLTATAADAFGWTTAVYPATATTGGIFYGFATNDVRQLAAGAATEILVGGGANLAPVWTTVTGIGSPMRGTSPTFTTSFIITGANAEPGAVAGTFVYDSTIAEFTGGALKFYNGATVQQIVDMTATTAAACTEGQLVGYDAANNLWKCVTAAGTGDFLADGSVPMTSFIDIGAAGVKLTGATGILTILGQGTGADENLTIDLNTDPNVVTFASGTSATFVFTPATAFTTTASAGTAFTPDTVGGASLGTSSLEFQNLYLGDAGVIYGQLDSTNTITSSATDWSFAKDVTIAGADLILVSITAGAGITGGDGTITLKGLGSGTDETMSIDLNTNNLITFASGSSATFAFTPAVAFTATASAGTAFTPDTAGGADLGTSALEFQNLYLGDSAVIYGQLDSSNTITSSATDWTFAKDITVSGGNINTGNIAFTIGDATTDSITFTTDGTGNAELTFPADSIGEADIDWGSGAGQVDLDDVPDSATYQKVVADDVDASGHINRLYDSDATGYITVTGLSVARAITLVDAAQTLVNLASNQTLTGTNTFEAATSFGDTDSAGTIKMYDGSTNFLTLTTAALTGDAVAITFPALSGAVMVTGVSNGDGLIFGDTYPPDAAGEIGYSTAVLAYHDGTASRTIMAEARASGGLLFGDSTPDTEGEIGYASDLLSYWGSSATRTVAALQLAQTFTANNVFGDADTDTVSIRGLLLGADRTGSNDAVQIAATLGTATYATTTDDLYVAGNVEVVGTVYAAGFTGTTATDGTRGITLTNNTVAYTPTAEHIYFYNNILYFATSGAEKTVAKLEDAQTFTGLKTFENGIYLGDTNTTTVFRLYDGSTNYVGIAVPAISADYTLTLPVDDGTSGQYLSTDGAGALSWGTPTATAAGATAGMVQYNATGTGGALAGDAGFIFTTATDKLTLGSSGGSTTGTLDLYYTGTTYSATITPNSGMSGDVTITLPAGDATLLGSGTNTFTGAQTVTAVNAASGSLNAYTLSGTLGIMNGSDTFRGLFLDYTNADHTYASAINTIALIDIDAIAGDAQTSLYGIRIGNLTGTTGAEAEVENAIKVGTGWDIDLELMDDTATITHSGSTSLTVASTSGTVLVESVTFTGGAISTATTLAMGGALSGVTTATLTHTAPDITLIDSDTGAAGTGNLLFASAGTQDVVGTIQVDVAGTPATYVEIDGVSETVDILKPLVLSAGVNIGTSQSIIGTTAITIGSNAQTVAIDSSDWDIDATGAMTGIGAITSNGTITTTGVYVAGSGPTTLTDSTGKILSASLLTVEVAQGGTGAITVTTNGIVYGASSTAYGVTAIGAEGNILVVGASPFVPAWSAGTGTGVPVRGTSPTFTTSILPSAAGATAIGTTALPFSSIFIGDAATNNVQLINTAADSAVVLTLSSTSGTVHSSPTTTTLNQAYLGTATAGLGAWSTYTLPATVTTNAILYSSSATAVASSTITTDGTDINAQALNLVSTGAISGGVKILTVTTGLTIGSTPATVGTDRVVYGGILMSTTVATVVLPAVVTGMSVCVVSQAQQIITITPNGSDGIWNLGQAARNTDGHTVLNGAAAAGEFLCLFADSATGWTTMGRSGTWTDQ